MHQGRAARPAPGGPGDARHATVPAASGLLRREARGDDRRMPRRSPEPWTPAERRILTAFASPRAIQDWLDALDYNEESVYRSPRHVMATRRAHCFDGALFAAAALRQLGHPPLIVDLAAVRDDDHVLAVFRRGKHWGAVAKSNCVGLRYREPVHRTVRELVMTYFEQYYNLNGEKTLRRFSRPLNLARLDRLEWQSSDEHLDDVVAALEATRHETILTPAMIRQLSLTDRRSFDAGLLGSNPKGLYQPAPLKPRSDVRKRAARRA